jgi:hypothetical protein
MKGFRLSLWVCSALVVGCATSPLPHSPSSGCGALPGSMLWARTELYFGLGKPDNTFTSDDEYQAFIDKEVAPRFKEGFTVLEGRGQYLDPHGRLWREPTRILILHYPPEPAKSLAIDAIRRAYKTMFQQESVMRVDAPQCVAF